MTRALVRWLFTVLDAALTPVAEWAFAETGPQSRQDAPAIDREREAGRSDGSQAAGRQNGVCGLCGSHAHCEHSWGVLGEHGWQWVEFCDECSGRMSERVGRA